MRYTGGCYELDRGEVEGDLIMCREEKILGLLHWVEL